MRRRKLARIDNHFFSERDLRFVNAFSTLLFRIQASLLVGFYVAEPSRRKGCRCGHIDRKASSFIWVFFLKGGSKNALVCVSEAVDTKPPPDSVLISLPFLSLPASAHRSGPHACHRYELFSKRLQSEDSLTLPHGN